MLSVPTSCASRYAPSLSRLMIYDMLAHRSIPASVGISTVLSFIVKCPARRAIQRVDEPDPLIHRSLGRHEHMHRLSCVQPHGYIVSVIKPRRITVQKRNAGVSPKPASAPNHRGRYSVILLQGNSIIVCTEYCTNCSLSNDQTFYYFVHRPLGSSSPMMGTLVAGAVPCSYARKRNIEPA